MKSLIVTADDVGLHPGMTEGAIRAHREGIVTACSIVANGNAFDDAVARLREVPRLELGVHLTLVEERSLTGMALPKKYPSFLGALAVRRITIAQVEKELRAQIDRVMRSGLRISHLNGHQHLHLLPQVFDIVTRLAAEYAIGYVRIVDDRGGRTGFMRRMAVNGLSALGRRARARVRGVKTNGLTIGVAEAGHLQQMEHLLDQVDGVTELVTHPGVNVDAYPAWGYEWDRETEALCAPQLREAIARRGITLATPSAI